jgi:hypothetical protein
MDQAATKCAGYFDCFFSTHVLEHVPSPGQSFKYAMQLLKPNGLFVSFTPNGSDANRAVEPNWSKHWGEAHPNFIDDIFLDTSFRFSPRAIGSSPVINASLLGQNHLRRLNGCNGVELFSLHGRVHPTVAKRLGVSARAPRFRLMGTSISRIRSASSTRPSSNIWALRTMATSTRSWGFSRMAGRLSLKPCAKSMARWHLCAQLRFFIHQHAYCLSMD